jgi:hypothetical protein
MDSHGSAPVPLNSPVGPLGQMAEGVGRNVF